MGKTGDLGRPNERFFQKNMVIALQRSIVSSIKKYFIFNFYVH